MARPAVLPPPAGLCARALLLLALPALLGGCGAGTAAAPPRRTGPTPDAPLPASGGRRAAPALVTAGARRGTTSATAETTSTGRVGGRPGARATHRAAASPPGAGPAVRAWLPLLASRGTAGAELPPEAERLIATLSRTRFRGERASAIAARARRLRLVDSTPAWLMPARGGLCLLWTERYGRSEANDALECVTYATALSGRLIADWQSLPGEPAEDHVLGVLPQGSSDLELELRSGRRVPVATADGAYAVRSPSPRAIRFRRGGTRHTVVVPRHESGPTLDGGL